MKTPGDGLVHRLLAIGQVPRSASQHC